MAHYAQTTAWLTYAKSVRKHHEDATNAYYLKFIKGNAIPTQHDLNEYEKVLAAMKAAAKQMNEDRVEMDHVAETFGGPSDMVIRTANTFTEGLKKAMHGHH